MSGETASARLRPMDALRGLAALCVAVFSHYQHWGGDKDHYPFMANAAASWLYGNSWLFVDMFFILSGWVLTLRYLVPLVEHRLGAKEFFWLRFSRLYPLHLVTLLVCAAVEWTLMAHGKPTVIYGSNNDLYHFFLQLTYLHSGWGENGNAYNMPSWSVCSEVFVYAVFFVIATKYRRGYPVACFVLFLLGMGTESARFNNPIFNEFMARAMVGFALGSLLYLGVTKLEQAGHDVGLGVASFVALVVVCGMSFVVGYDGWIGKTPFNFTLVVFPLTVVSALKFPPLAKLLSLRPFTFLGDISYAVYLVHVPVQMLTLSVTQAMHVTLPVNTNPFFYAYTATLIVVGAAAHWGLERPAQRWLRARWKARALLTAPATPPPTSRAAAA